jgi:Trypsin-like peptidase domain
MSARVFALMLFFAAATTFAQAPAVVRNDRFESVYRRARRAVVVITARDAKGAEVAEGSGFAVSANGKIVTNLHVIEGAASADIRFSDGQTATVRGTTASDPATDLAIVKVSREKTPFLRLADSSRVSVGEEVLTIGSPLSLEATATTGIVSALRSLDGIDVIQTSAPISPGSSGGPLLNLAGEVLGVTSFQLKNAQNLNFAISARYIQALLGRNDATPFPAMTIKTEAPALGKYDSSQMALDQKQMDALMNDINGVTSASEKVHVLLNALSRGELSLSSQASAEMILGAEYGVLGKRDESVGWYEAALKDSVDAGVHLVTLHRRLCGEYVGSRRFDEAIDMCTAAVAEAKASDNRDTDLSGSWALLGFAYQETHHIDEAIDAYNAALSADPSEKVANRQLVGLLRARGDRKELKQLYDRLRSSNEQLWRELFPDGPH